MALHEFAWQQIVARLQLMVQSHFVERSGFILLTLVNYLRLDLEVPRPEVVPSPLLVKFVELGSEQALLTEVKLDL